jgi:RNA polymerase sigma-70 factor, ECF subfamily
MSIDRSDFADVYAQHLRRVYAFHAYRTGNRHAAEDLTQATFERALRAWPRFDPRRSSQRTWLLSIARNLLIDAHRRERPVPLESPPGRVASAPGPEARFAGSPELAQALAALSDRERELVALRFGADLTGPEIAALLEITADGAHQGLSRALRKLRATLEAAPAADGVPRAAA